MTKEPVLHDAGAAGEVDHGADAAENCRSLQQDQSTVVQPFPFLADDDSTAYRGIAAAWLLSAAVVDQACAVAEVDWRNAVVAAS